MAGGGDENGLVGELAVGVAGDGVPPAVAALGVQAEFAGGGPGRAGGGTQGGGGGDAREGGEAVEQGGVRAGGRGPGFRFRFRGAGRGQERVVPLAVEGAALGPAACQVPDPGRGDLEARGVVAVVEDGGALEAL